MPKPQLDLRLYLVTGRELLPPGKDYYESLEESLQGGVTLVQVREKKADTAEVHVAYSHPSGAHAIHQFVDVALRTIAICDKYNVPVLINDRIDVALATKAAGVHLGQTDMPVDIARKLLPADAIIGISAGTPEEAQRARDAKADYIGIGACWWTASKQLEKDVLGVRGVGPLLDVIDGSGTRAVAIGGIKSTNVLRTLHGAVGPTTSNVLDGVAIISDIVSSKEPKFAAERLSRAVREFHNAFAPLSRTPRVLLVDRLLAQVGQLMTKIRETTPLIHQITNNVTINSLANVTLALRASPIMATTPQEMEDLAKVGGALLINFGTITDKQGMLAAGHHYNLNRKPVVFDPVGVGATAFRRAAAKEILNTWQATVIKGNAGEIGALFGSAEVSARGVDSVGAGFSNPADVVRQLARRECCVVVMTGKDDYISDGQNVVKLSNGHPILGDITGSGCMVGSCVATFCAAARLRAPEGDDVGSLCRGDILSAAVGGVLSLTIAAEIAASRPDVKGSGTFLPALIDEVYNLTPEVVESRARVEIL